MSSAFSDYIEYTIARQMFKFTDSANLVATAIWIGLHQTTLTDTGGTSGSEVSSTGGYTRMETTAADWTVERASTRSESTPLRRSGGMIL